MIEIKKFYRGFDNLLKPLEGVLTEDTLDEMAHIFHDYSNGKIDDDEIANDGFIGICVDYYCGDADVEDVIDYLR